MINPITKQLLMEIESSNSHYKSPHKIHKSNII